jgi:hypothetical protein
MTEPPTGWTTPGSQPAPEGPQWTAPPSYGSQAPWAATDPTWVMAPQPGVIPLRPLGLGEILDGAIKIIRRYPKPTLGLSAAIALVVTVINVLFVLVLDTGARSAFSGNSGDGGSFSSNTNLSGGPGAIVSFLAGLVLTGVLVAVVGKAVLGQPAPPGEIWRQVKGRLWALLGLSLLTGLLIALPVGAGVLIGVLAGSAALAVLLGLAGAVGSVYLYVRLSLAAPTLVLEKAGVTTALKRSGVLVKGAWWRTLGILLLSSIIVGFITAIVTVPVAVIALVASGGDAAGSGLQIITHVLTGVLSVFIAPFGAGVRAMVYVDRRMRAEGLDVALQAAATAPPAL